MRSKRKNKYKRLRHQKMIKTLFIAIIIPSIFICLGYLVAAVIILPSMSG